MPITSVTRLFSVGLLLSAFLSLSVLEGLGDDGRPPTCLEESPFGFIDVPKYPELYADLDIHWLRGAEAMSSWERVETVPGVYDFSPLDSEITRLYEKGLNIVMAFRPVNRLYGTYFREREPGEKDEYPDGHLDDYAKYMASFVERYDGDGIDDAPGSPVIRYYQFVHELGLSRNPDYWTLNPDRYAEVFELVHGAMKKASPKCTLFFPGTHGSGRDYEFKDEGAPEDGFIVKVLNIFESRGKKLGDIGFDYHFWAMPERGQKSSIYSLGKDYRQHEIAIKKIKHCYQRFGYSDKEVDIISMEAGMTGLEETERAQARYALKINTLALSLGQKLLCWTTSAEYGHHPSERQDRAIFAHMGLVHHPSNIDGLTHRKLAYYTYKLMVQNLTDCDWSKTNTIIDGDDNLYVYRFVKDGCPFFIAWWDYYEDPTHKEGDTKPLRLEVDVPKATVICTVPEGENGGAFGEKATFKTEIVEAEKGKIKIALGPDPVYIHEGVVSQPSFTVDKTPVKVRRRPIHGERPLKAGDVIPRIDSPFEFGGISPFVRRFDANRDGTVSREEFDGPPQLFDRLDRDGDGLIRNNEAPREPVRQREERRVSPSAKPPLTTRDRPSSDAKPPRPRRERDE